jgi:putative two-component system response regulator
MNKNPILYITNNCDDLLDLFKDDNEIKIDTANDAKTALEKILNGHEYNLIVVDNSSCIDSEIEIFKSMKQKEFIKLIPIILYSKDGLDTIIKYFDSKIFDDVTCRCYEDEITKQRLKNYIRLYKYRIGSYSIKEEEIKKRIKESTNDIKKDLAHTKKSEYEIVIKLGKAAEFRDLETGMHIKRMSKYSSLLAELYGMSKDEVDIINYASALHDVGKVGIPDRILLKPGRLSPEEFEIMKIHTTIGGKILAHSKAFPILEAGRIIALQHHEKFDGTGYPNGLSGEDIHLYGRIVSIADVFDALISKRVYKNALSLEKTIEILTSERGKHFDPELLDLFLNNIDKFVKIKDKYKDEDLESSLYKLDHMVY